MYFPEISQRSSSAAIDHYLPISCKNASNIEGYERFFAGGNFGNLKKECNPINKYTKPKNLFSQQTCSRRSLEKMDLNSKWISLNEEKGIVNKRFLLKNNEKKFPNDFFENMRHPERKVLELNEASNFNLNQFNVRSSTKNISMLKKNNSEYTSAAMSPSIAYLKKNEESPNLDSFLSNRKKEKVNLQIKNPYYNNYPYNNDKVVMINRYHDSFDEYTSSSQNNKPKSSFAKVGRLTPLNFENNPESFILITHENETDEKNEYYEKTIKKSILEIEFEGNQHENNEDDKLFTFYNNNCQNSEDKEMEEKSKDNETKLDPNMTSTFSKKRQIMRKKK